MTSWQGLDFQKYCMMLLQKRYSVVSPHNLQIVPDAHQGDLGLEAFTHDGHAYQCYAAQEPLSVKDCYEKQRNKLTRDLNKLKKKSVDITALLGNVTLEKYVFMVHRHDSKSLITHANEKAAEVVSWGLPFISNGFSIVIETLDSYAAEQHTIHAVPSPLIEAVPLVDGERDAWTAENATLLDTAIKKLDRITSSAGTRDSVVDALLTQYLEGDNSLERLKSTSPDAYQAVLRSKSHKETLLVLEHPPSAIDTQATLSKIADELAEDLREVANLDKAMAQKLAWAAAADWLMRCPLDFGVHSE